MLVLGVLQQEENTATNERVFQDRQYQVSLSLSSSVLSIVCVLCVLCVLCVCVCVGRCCYCSYHENESKSVQDCVLLCCTHTHFQTHTCTHTLPATLRSQEEDRESDR